MRQGFPLMCHEMPQQLKFFWGQADRVSVHRNGATLEIDLQVRRYKNRRIFRYRAAQLRSYTSREFFGSKRLDDKIVRAGIKCLHFVALAIPNRQHDDGDITHTADFPAGFNSRRARQIHIQEYQPHALFTDQFERFLSCASPKFCPPTESRVYGNIPTSDSGITPCYVEPASPLDRRTDSPLPQPRESRFGESRAPATTRGLETSASSATAGIGRQTLLGHRESILVRMERSSHRCHA